MRDGLLAGDIGGTNARFAIVHGTGRGRVIDQFKVLPGDDFDTFEAALDHYLRGVGELPVRACLGFAGPVREGAVTVTHRPHWRVSEAELRDRFGFGQVRLINDFLAMARSVPELPASAFEEICPGAAVDDAPILVAGPGTGFGVATLVPEPDGRWRVLTGEGGHAAFAPRDDLGMGIFRILLREHGYVSVELVTSGSGLVAVHAAFCELFGRPVQNLGPEDMRARADSGDEMYAALIALRAEAVMSAAGNAALANGALGGVVIAGGVAERISDAFQQQAARDRFADRGPNCGYLASCPVRLMRSATAPLIGAAAFFEQQDRL